MSASGLVARRTIQAEGSNYPRFRVKMFGMSVGVVGVWAMSDVQVMSMPICSFYCKTNIVIPTCMSDLALSLDSTLNLG